ncbi:VirB4 family type IV secretion/conjugal transfer ATPase, partial [Burkholderia cepacia]
RTLDDALIQFVKLEGLYESGLDDDTVDVYKRRRNTALETIADSNVGIYVYDIRRKSDRWPAGTYSKWFPNYLNDRLREHRRAKPLYRHEIYVAVVRYRHHHGMNGWIDRLLNRFSLLGGTGQIESIDRQARDLEERVDSLMKSLAHYAPRRLGSVEETAGTCCEMARFLRYLLTLEDGPILADAHHLGQAIATAYMQFGRSEKLGQQVFESRGVNHWRIGQVMGMSRWPSGSSAGMSDAFVKLPVELIVTQKFFPIDKLDASMAAATAERRASHDSASAPLAGEILELRRR